MGSCSDARGVKIAFVVIVDSGVLAVADNGETTVGLAMFIALATPVENVGMPASAAGSGMLPNAGLGVTVDGNWSDATKENENNNMSVLH